MILKILASLVTQCKKPYSTLGIYFEYKNEISHADDGGSYNRDISDLVSIVHVLQMLS